MEWVASQMQSTHIWLSVSKCFTVRHHISTGLYCSLHAQRRTVLL